MTHQTITYEQAKKWFAAGRKYRPIGVKLTEYIWLNYDEENDRYTLSYVHSKYYTETNEKGEVRSYYARANRRDKYTMRQIAYVYPDHAHIFHPDGLNTSSNIARSFFESYFNCTYRRIKSVRIKGFEWAFFHADLSHWKETNGAREVVWSGEGLRIYPDGRHEPTHPVLLRTHKKDQQKALNARIKAVRRAITLRAKLGGFSAVNWEEKNAQFLEEYGVSYAFHLLNQPKVVNEMFMAVDGNDHETMLPVLWLSAVRDRPYYWLSPKWHEIGCNYDWKRAFNRLVDFVREDLRNEQGAVEYVPYKQA